MGADDTYVCACALSSGAMSADTLRIKSTPPVLISAIWVATSGMARMTRCLNAGLPRQWPSKASRRMYWSRFHSTNFHGPVPTAAVVPNASSFFFQAEDGIRDGHVTGVQTCALPIFVAVLASLMVSYTRARAEALGVECKVGL